MDGEGRGDDVQVHDKVVGWSRGWGEEDDDCYDPVEEELERC